MKLAHKETTVRKTIHKNESFFLSYCFIENKINNNKLIPNII